MQKYHLFGDRIKKLSSEASNSFEPSGSNSLLGKAFLYLSWCLGAPYIGKIQVRFLKNLTSPYKQPKYKSFSHPELRCTKILDVIFIRGRFQTGIFSQV